MKNKFKNKILFIGAIIGIFAGGNTSQASNSSIIQSESPVLINEMNNNINEANNNTEGSRVLPNTIQGDGTLKKAEDYVERKLFDVVGFFQSFIKPLTYVTFIVSAITILLGVVSNSSKSTAVGILGLVASVAIYVLVVFAPQIVEYFGAWLSM